MDVAKASGQASSGIANLNMSISHTVVAVKAVNKVIKFLAGFVGLCGDCAVVPDWLGLRRWWRRAWFLWRWWWWSRIGVFPQAESKVMVLGFQLPVVGLDHHGLVTSGSLSSIEVVQVDIDLG